MEAYEHNTTLYTIIDGIRRYGETSPVVEDDVTIFERTPESYLHIIRHVHSLSETAYAQALLYTEGNTDRIEALLKTTASKFHPQITDPLTIISFAEEHIQEKVQKRERLLWIKTPRNDYFCYVSAYISPTDKRFLGLSGSDALGDCHVIKITEDIAPHITKRIRGKAEKIDDVIINIVEDTAPPSNTLIITLYKPDISSPATIYSAYTGIIAPPLPHDTHTKEEAAYSTDWWSEHTFII